METRRASQRNYHIIYKTVCHITDKFYIGMHSTDNLDDGYMGSGTHLWRSIDKYGKAAHTVEILAYLPDRKALSDREKQILSEAKKHPQCMNIAWGGEGYYDRPPTAEETKKKLSEASKQYVRTKEWYDKIVATRKAGVGYGKSEEERAKISKALTGKRHSDESIKRVTEKNRGQKRTKEQCENISKALKGKNKGINKVFSEQHKESIRLSRIGMKHSEEAKANMRKPRKKGINRRKCTIDSIQIFESVGAMEKALGRGKTGTRSPNFRYVD